MAALEIRLVGEERIENYANCKCGTRSEQKKKKSGGRKKKQREKSVGNEMLAKVCAGKIKNGGNLLQRF